MVLWILLEGSGELFCDGLREPVVFQTGDTVVLPAGLKKGRVRTTDNALWLEVSIPIASSLSEFPRPERE